MNWLERAIRANRLRPTRFHTERGELLPLRAVPDAMNSIRRRATGKSMWEEPWMVPSAVRALSRVLDSEEASVLELGSGASTMWFAARAKDVVSFEANRDWAQKLRHTLSAGAVDNVSLREVRIDETPAALRQLRPDSFDAVVIDCSESAGVDRLDCLAAAAPLVRPGGVLVLDDSDRERLRRAPSMISGWRVERHVGMKPFPLMVLETTLFWRPDGVRPVAEAQPVKV